MKFILLLFVIASAVAQSLDWDEKVKMMQEQYDEVRGICLAKLEVSQTEFKQAEVSTNPKTRTEKCIVACLLEELGFLVDGKFSRAKLDNVSEFWYSDNIEHLTISKSIAQTCEKEVEAAKMEDNCDVAAEIIKCVSKQTKLYLPNAQAKTKDASLPYHRT